MRKEQVLLGGVLVATVLAGCTAAPTTGLEEGGTQSPMSGSSPAEDAQGMPSGNATTSPPEENRTSPVATPPPTVPQATCATTGVLFETVEAVETRGSAGQEFEVGEGGCVVTVEFRRQRQIGFLEVEVASDRHELMAYRGVAVTAGPAQAVPGVNLQTSHTGTVPPGTYTYTFSATGSAAFSLRVIAE